MWTISEPMPARARAPCVSISELIPYPLMIRAFSGIGSCAAGAFAAATGRFTFLRTAAISVPPNGALYAFSSSAIPVSRRSVLALIRSGCPPVRPSSTASGPSACSNARLWSGATVTTNRESDSEKRK